jgi:hypothetical protein
MVAAIIATFLYEPNPKPEKALASARVQASSTALLREPRANAANRFTLYRGQQVNVLERVRTNQPFIRVQFVSPKRNSRPGFVRLVDLAEWNNDRFAWDVIMLGTPAEGASASDRDKFAEALIQFSRDFPSSAHSDGACLHAAHLYLNLATESDKAGAAGPKDESLKKAEDALDRVSEREKDEVAALRKLIADMRQPEAGPPPQTDPLLPLYQRAADLYYTHGDFEEPKKLIARMLSINPTYGPAIRLRESIKSAESALGR